MHSNDRKAISIFDEHAPRPRRLRRCPDGLHVAEQVPPEELEFRGDPDNRKDVMANRKRIQVPPLGAVLCLAPTTVPGKKH